MKEIKFRVWDKNYKIMHCAAAVRSIFSVSELTNCDDFVALQYTGLKDKYGVEIYEGDILDFWGRKFLVVYNLGGFGCFGLNEVWHPLGDTIYRPTTVIGNRYENPELLKEGNQ